MEPSQFRKPKGASRAATPPTSTTSTTEEAKGATSKSKRKIASNNDGESAERIRNMPGLWNSFLDNVWEGDDCRLLLHVSWRELSGADLLLFYCCCF